MASSYPHSMAPCRWFSNRKDCIWKHKPTIYTPNKQWDVNPNASTPCHPLLLTHPQPPSFAWFCYGVANTPFGWNATWNGSLFRTHCLATKTCDAQEKGRKKEKRRWARIWWRSPWIKARHPYSVTPAQTVHSGTMQPLNQSYGLTNRCSDKDNRLVGEYDTKVLPLVSVRALTLN